MKNVDKDTKIKKILEMNSVCVDFFITLGINDVKKHKTKTLEDLCIENELDITETIKSLNEFLKKNTPSVAYHVWDWVKTTLLALLFTYLITNFIIINARIPSPSMVNTLNVKDRIVASRLSYIFEEPERGDIVIFKFPDNEEDLYVKRVIGLPGETVTIVEGKIFIDDSTSPIEENYLPEEMLGSFGPYVVPSDSYFMLGDNRNYSNDSRAWNTTFVHESKFLGKVIFKYYPKIEMIE